MNKLYGYIGLPALIIHEISCYFWIILWVLFLGIFIYLLITFKYSFPSNQNFLTIRYAKLFSKYSWEDGYFVKFMTAKGIFKDEEVILPDII